MTEAFVLFDCEKLSARLTKKSCAERHLSGNFLICSDCQLGAVHAGKSIIPIVPLKTCVRCRRSAQRLIHGALCPSCDNRDRERRKGKNARGNAPVKLRPVVEGEVVFFSKEKRLENIKLFAVDSLELSLRVSKKSLLGICAIRTRQPQIFQADLF